MSNNAALNKPDRVTGVLPVIRGPVGFHLDAETKDAVDRQFDLIMETTSESERVE